MAEKPEGLALLRAPFPANQISKLPRPTKAQKDALQADRRLGIRCELCGQWHHKDTIHFDYVGHAALTHRLLDCDPMWTWEPVAFGPDGAPIMDRNGGIWIKLTVCGVTRMGYGHPDGKQGGDAVKECIGDALRNAAMRFGAALDLWHKGGDLHGDEDETPAPKAQDTAPERWAQAVLYLSEAETLDDLNARFKNLPDDARKAKPVIDAGAKRKAELVAEKEHNDAAMGRDADLGGDKIPY